MTATARFRGHCIYFDEVEDVWRYVDTHARVPENWKGRGCGHCGRAETPEGHDGCLGTLPPPVVNACCGHGNENEAYVQFGDGRPVLRGQEAVRWQEAHMFEEID